MRYPVCLFDLDGTLTDPTEGITKSFQYALERFDIAAEPHELRPLIGPPLHQSFMERYGFDEPKTMRAVGYYREYFSEKGIFENQLFEAIPGLLESLTAAGCRLSLVTSKPEVYSRQILEHFRLDGFFDAVIAPGLDLAGADKTTLVRRALDGHDGRPSGDFVMVGDRKHDVQGAVANTIDAVGVTYGAGAREELEHAGATHIVDTPAELATLLLNDA